MRRPSIHKRTTYYLPSWQGGDVVLPLCQRAATGWSINCDVVYRLADAGVTCPVCLGIMAHGRRPCGGRKVAA